MASSRGIPIAWIICRLFAATLLTISSPVLEAEDAQKQSLRILIYGATGKIGTHVVDEALERGHLVTAVSRTPSRIERQHERLIAAKGDILDMDSIRQLVTGQDVIIVSVRGVIGDPKTSGQALQFLAAENLVTVLRDMEGEIPRMIHVGGAGTLEVEPGVLYAERLPKIFLPKSLEIEIAGQIAALEYLRSVDDISWSIVTPPRNFTNRRRTGEYRIGGDRLMKEKNGRSRISRADFAVALIDEAENASHVRKRFSVAY